MRKDKVVKVAAGVVVLVIILLLLFPEQRQQFAEYVQTWVKGVIESANRDEEKTAEEPEESGGSEAGMPEESENPAEVPEEPVEEPEPVEEYNEVFQENSTENEQVLPADTSVPDHVGDADSNAYTRTGPQEDSGGGSNLLPFVSF